MSLSALQKNKHLLWRAGFGPNITQIKNIGERQLSDIWKELAADYVFKPLKLTADAADLDYREVAMLDAASRKELQRRNRLRIIELNLEFLNQMINSEDQLREKMAFFWHGHFACRISNSGFNLQLLNTIREKALGNFGEVLQLVSQSPAMLVFLNNQQNRKNHPNENFARELMELFTMGRGNYTEKDVREAARAFTGWSFQQDGSFLQRPKLHDFGSKTFLGRTGDFDGGDILKIILEQKATSRFIVSKIYKFFVNEEPNPSIINDLSEKFFASNYDIKELMTEIFTAKWFYTEENLAAKIKSPIELMVGIMRVLPMNVRNPENLVVYQKLLGQMLLFPPNVSGWPSGKSWIDSSTMMLRLQIPQIWSGLRPLEVEPKSDDDIEMGMKTPLAGSKNFKNPNIEIDWNLAENIFKNKKITDFLLQKTGALDENTLQKFSDNSVKQTIINVMSTPEFQLC